MGWKMFLAPTPNSIGRNVNKPLVSVGKPKTHLKLQTPLNSPSPTRQFVDPFATHSILTRRDEKRGTGPPITQTRPVHPNYQSGKALQETRQPPTHLSHDIPASYLTSRLTYDTPHVTSNPTTDLPTDKARVNRGGNKLWPVFMKGLRLLRLPARHWARLRLPANHWVILLRLPARH